MFIGHVLETVLAFEKSSAWLRQIRVDYLVGLYYYFYLCICTNCYRMITTKSASLTFNDTAMEVEQKYVYF